MAADNRISVKKGRVYTGKVVRPARTSITRRIVPGVNRPKARTRRR